MYYCICTPSGLEEMLTSLEAFGYEAGMVARASTYLFFTQLLYVVSNYMFTVSGSVLMWHLIMYLLATIHTLANDNYIFGENLLQREQIAQHVRTGVDLGIYILFQQFLRVGDARRPQESQRIAKSIVDSLGKPVSVIFFMTALFLSNLAFLAAVRLLINSVISVRIAFHKFVLWFFGTNTSENEADENDE